MAASRPLLPRSLLRAASSGKTPTGLLPARRARPSARPLLLLSGPAAPRSTTAHGFSALCRRQDLLRPATAAAVGAGARRLYSQRQQPAESKILSFEEVRKLSEDPKSKVIIVDVREPAELKTTGWIPTAVNIPVTSAPDSFHISEDEFEDRFGYRRPAHDEEVVFYCRSGVRSRAAAGLAREAGWRVVGEYPGSWTDWAAKGGKVQR